MTTTANTRSRHPASPTGRYRRAAQDSGYLLLSLPLAIVGFVLMITTISTSAPLLVILLIGFAVLAVGLAAANALGNLERRRLAAVGHPMTDVPRFRSPGGRVPWVVARLRHGQGWLDLLHQLLNFPISLVTFVLTVTWWSVGVAAALYPLFEWALPAGNQGLAYLLSIDPWLETVGYMIVGILMLLALPWVMRGLVLLHAGWARITLGARSDAHLRERVDALTQSRAAVVGAEAETLRRIERDLHDGPQQRLVRISMDLQTAQRRLAAGDQKAAEQLVTASIGHVQGSLAELRTLSRGIAPPILVDRGLRAAVVSAAGQCPIPVEVVGDLEPDQRLAPARETAAYFVVTEALANAAKHSGAGRVTVRIDLDDGVLQVVVHDDGVGGAHVGKGHGLAGLADRLAGVDGRLEVTSPDGGGTLVRALIP
ncbi:sensor domain-containing protein [Georgenia sp. MJ173]|uniref:sensor histidine kinase n=1 Tax=Georgenia sunbinii TaxID=3117728 RepID=UPI002F25F36E